MQTEVLHVNRLVPEEEPVRRAAALLRAGGLVAFPTETVYGLGANALDPAACGRLFDAKGRPPNNPVIVHVAGPSQAREVVADWPDIADRLAGQFWPGPLTVVLPKSPRVPDVVTAGGPTVAVRVPAHPVALALLRVAAIPVAAPSANRSGHLSPTRAEHVVQDLAGRIDMILDAGPTRGGVESTVLDLTCRPPRLLRPGLVTPAQLEAVIGPIDRSLHAPAAGALPSPGMLPRHYAPHAPLETVDIGGEARVTELARQGTRAGWLKLGGSVSETPAGVTVIVMPTEPAAYASQLYAALHELDDAQVQRIIVELPPEGEEWLTVRDRLRRASASV